MKKSKKTPQNKVGHHVPTEKEADQLLANIRDAKTYAATLGPVLTPAERRGVSRPRRGSEPTSDLILRLAKEHNVQSRVWSVDAARRDESVFKAIETATQEAFVLWKTLRDVYMQARGEHWDSTLYFYGALSQASESDADLALNLGPAIEFFARGPQESDDAKSPDDAEADHDHDEDGLT